MVGTYLWEEMCHLCTFTRKYYKEAKRTFNNKNRGKETLNMTLEDEMPIFCGPWSGKLVHELPRGVTFAYDLCWVAQEIIGKVSLSSTIVE